MRAVVIAACLSATAALVAAQRGAAPAEPVPRLPDGTPNLGRVAGEKGIWNVPWIRNMAMRIGAHDGGSDLPSSRGLVGLVGHDLAHHGSTFEPQVPFMPCAAAVDHYDVANDATYDPARYCLPPAG